MVIEVHGNDSTLLLQTACSLCTYRMSTVLDIVYGDIMMRVKVVGQQALLDGQVLLRWFWLLRGKSGTTGPGRFMFQFLKSVQQSS